MSKTHTEAAADVVIIGAGPVGLYTALRLARKGWRVHIIERWPEPYGLPRAVALDPESLRALQDVGLAEQMDSRAVREQWFDWRNGEGEILLRMPSVVATPSGWLPMTFSQPELEALLEQAVAAEPLVTVSRGAVVAAPEDILEDVDGVTVRARNADSGRYALSVRGRYVIGADGANSVVRDRIGTAVTDLGFFYDWLVVDVVPTVDRDWGDAGVQICSPERPTTFISGGPGRRRWEFMLLPGESREEMSREEAAWSLLEKYDVGPSNAILERHAVYRFQARWAADWNQGRLLLAGDAAHQMPPFAGQGLNSGMRDALNLTWKLDLVLAGGADPSILDSYTSERREHIRFAIRFSIELGKIICVLDADEARERDARMIAAGARNEMPLPPMPEGAFSDGVVRRLTDGSAQPEAGRVFPQFRVSAGDGPVRFDDLFGLRPVLLLAPGADLQLPHDVESEFAELGGRVVRLMTRSGAGDGDAIDVDGSYAEALAGIGAVAALQRPDGYFFGSAATLSETSELVRQYVDRVRDYARASTLTVKG